MVVGKCWESQQGGDACDWMCFKNTSPWPWSFPNLSEFRCKVTPLLSDTRAQIHERLYRSTTTIGCVHTGQKHMRLFLSCGWQSCVYVWFCSINLTIVKTGARAQALFSHDYYPKNGHRNTLLSSPHLRIVTAISQRFFKCIMLYMMLLERKQNTKKCCRQQILTHLGLTGWLLLMPAG